MDSRLLRSLVLGCGLLLALPPGWCCVPAPAVAAETPQAPREPSCCCRHPAPSEDQPAPAVPAPPAGRCCCEKESTEPPSASTVDLDPAGSLPLVDNAVCPALSLRDTAAYSGPRVHAPPPRLLYCVWLC